jgi:hypothetical protein
MDARQHEHKRGVETGTPASLTTRGLRDKEFTGLTFRRIVGAMGWWGCVEDGCLPRARCFHRKAGW